MSILNCMAFIPGITIPAVIAAMICGIIYWVKIAGYKNILAGNNWNGLAGR
ncbi:hypothetical protein [Pollutibacter soli]|uniref:hypothetical protein n=1 Tax=Pollutibacter soli TaxID=3034157 RepID=UPI003013E29D